jgi:hypothetical protein
MASAIDRTPARPRRPLPELPAPELQHEHRQQRQKPRRAMCSCGARPTPPAATHEERFSTAATAPPMRSGKRADSPADSPPDSPTRAALPASPPATMRLQLDDADDRLERLLPERVEYMSSPMPLPQVLPRATWRANVAPLPYRPSRTQRRQGAGAAPEPPTPASVWAPLPYRIEPRPGEPRNEAIFRVMEQQVPGPVTPTPGEAGRWDGPLQFDKLTTVVDKYVYNQPWDRIVAAYHWRSHADLEGDLHATLLPMEPPDAQGRHVMQYDCSIDMPRVVKVVARCDSYRWIERQEIDVAARSFRAYSSTKMWRDRFHSLEFIEMFAVSDTETYVRKGLIADTPSGYPPKWVCDWIAKAYSQRSDVSCHVIDRIADTVGEKQPGAQPPKAEHKDVLRIRAHLQMPPLSKRIKQARALWSAPS